MLSTSATAFNSSIINFSFKLCQIPIMVMRAGNVLEKIYKGADTLIMSHLDNTF